MSNNVDTMTRKQFDALPFREGWSTPVECDCIIILPTRKRHESGYRCMDFVAVRKNEAICRLSGSSDVIHIDGIGGYGKLVGNGLPKFIPPSGWSIDCLPKSGLLRMWPSSNRIECSGAYSSFEIFALAREK